MGRYAGWLGTIAARHEEEGEVSPSVSLSESGHRLAAVAGTSTCHLVQSKEGVFVGGVWGPYKDAVFPGWWMNEGGQSSTGQLIDFIISTHPAHQELKDIAKDQNKNIHDVLRETLEGIRGGEGAESWTEVIAHTHFYPDFHGLFYTLTHTLLQVTGVLLKVTVLPSRTRVCVDPL